MTVCVAAVVACGGSTGDGTDGPESAADAASAPTTSDASPQAEGDALAESVTEQEDAYIAGLSQYGVAMQSRETAVQLGRGICSRIEAGTDESDILRNLETVTAFLSRQPGAQLDSAEVAQRFVDAATAELC
ncbi:DUF732 domain-containing protein [Hoyosella rhizosphaerae]|nr:DUF732 domain-containing protein [Hoyosella rhizosphaerae]MBN4925511.1 DUF732 domain-containing protein [Hoyosella rhizosphaerae]